MDNTADIALEEYKSYVSGGKKKNTGNEIGGLGELLKARLAEKKNR